MIRSKRFSWVLALLLVSLGFGALPAEAQAVTLEELTVEFWPDYDDPSVLVLLTGRLPANTTLPATVTVALPAEARLNAVARVTADGAMMADIAYEQQPTSDSLELTTPDPVFRVEYYAPYEATGLERDFTWTWDSPVAISSLLVSVQQPAAATSITVMPAPISVAPGNNGLQYHNLPAQALAVGERFRIDIAYAVQSTILTVETQPTQVDLAPLPASDGSGAGGLNWWLIGGAVGLLMGMLLGAWFFLVRPGTRRSTAPVATARPRKQAPARPADISAKAGRAPASRGSVAVGASEETPVGDARARFCHQCGETISAGDRFCRYCGTKLRV
jgi:hypothetical protein